MSKYIIVHAAGHANAWKNGYIAEHRLVMSHALNRPLKVTEIVHHKNGDPHDNSLSNLEIHTRASHAKHHQDLLRPQRKKYQAKVCARCQKLFIATHNNYGRNRYCSRACVNIFGENALHAKLSDAQVNEIRALKGHLSHRQLAQRFNVGKTHIGRLLRRECR